MVVVTTAIQQSACEAAVLSAAMFVPMPLQLKEQGAAGARGFEHCRLSWGDLLKLLEQREEELDCGPQDLETVRGFAIITRAAPPRLGACVFDGTRLRMQC